jgi:hypothetical protein
LAKKIQKGNVYVVVDIDAAGKCKHGFKPLKDIPVDEKATVGEYIEKRDAEIAELKKELANVKNMFATIISAIGGIKNG